MGRIKQSQITYWCHEIIRSQAEAGGCYIDATMGKGNDTLFLCELAGENGKVLAFDIQQEALDATRELLRTHGKEQQAELILDGHEHMDRYAMEESTDVICFNFGYLPGGDHKTCNYIPDQHRGNRKRSRHTETRWYDEPVYL